MKLYLSDSIKKYFSPTEPYFDQLMALQGECFRHREGRKAEEVAALVGATAGTTSLRDGLKKYSAVAGRDEAVVRRRG